MTPRRVKRRSYTRSSARSAGKALKKDTLSDKRRSVRSASGAIGAITKNRDIKSINPVTRLMQVMLKEFLAFQFSQVLFSILSITQYS